jgi:hypothetical protein
MPKLRLNGKDIRTELVIGPTDSLVIAAGGAESKMIVVDWRNGKLHLSCNFEAIDEIEGEYLHKVISAPNQRQIRNAPVEWLIAEGSIATLLDIVLMWGERVAEFSHTAKYNLWHKLYLDGARHDCIFHDPKKQENYDKVREICRTR